MTTSDDFIVPPSRILHELSEMTPMVRVLIEMPEEDALALRAVVNDQRKAQQNKVWVSDGSATRGSFLEMHIREILLFG